mgnify:CR=1 FL=1
MKTRSSVLLLPVSTLCMLPDWKEELNEDDNDRQFTVNRCSHGQIGYDKTLCKHGRYLRFNV